LFSEESLLSPCTPTACGLPWEFPTDIGIRKNSLEDLGEYLEQFHGGRYLVFNLAGWANAFDPQGLDSQVCVCVCVCVCVLQRSCSTQEFSWLCFFQVLHFEFPHHAPTLNILFKVTSAMATWLRAHQDNVAVVTCEDGMARTGLAIACFLLFTGECVRSCGRVWEHVYLFLCCVVLCCAVSVMFV